jgi:hypothetical protein
MHMPSRVVNLRALTSYSLLFLLLCSRSAGAKPKVVWLVIAALRTMRNLDPASIPENTLVMDRDALVRMYGPTLVSWMRLVDVPEAPIPAIPAAPASRQL